MVGNWPAANVATNSAMLFAQTSTATLFNLTITGVMTT